MEGDRFFGCLDNRIRRSEREFYPSCGGRFVDPIDEPFACEDGGGGDGGVGFSFGSLFESDGESFFAERALKHFRAGELVAKRAGAIGAGCDEFFDHSGVAPGEQAVEISERRVHFVVTLGTDGDDFGRAAGRFANDRGELTNAGGAGDPFGIHDAGFDQAPGDGGIGIGTGDDQRSEEISLAALIDAEVRGKPVGIENLFVAEAGFSGDFGFEGEPDEVFGVFSLNQNFRPFFINRDVEFSLAGGKQGVGLRHQFVAVAFKNRSQLFRLGESERSGVSGHG